MWPGFGDFKDGRPIGDPCQSVCSCGRRKEPQEYKVLGGAVRVRLFCPVCDKPLPSDQIESD